jgi:hypothetical protein
MATTNGGALAVLLLGAVFLGASPLVLVAAFVIGIPFSIPAGVALLGVALLIVGFALRARGHRDEPSA